VRLCIHVLSDVVLFKGVPIGVTRFSNNVIQFVFPTSILLRPYFYPLNNRSLCDLKML
jgi:hypothetical protein